MFDETFLLPPFLPSEFLAWKNLLLSSSKGFIFEINHLFPTASVCLCVSAHARVSTSLCVYKISSTDKEKKKLVWQRAQPKRSSSQPIELHNFLIRWNLKHLFLLKYSVVCIWLNKKNLVSLIYLKQMYLATAAKPGILKISY